ncbi:MAG: MBOAT family protein [Bacteroidales bacterium]|nr:MBOAT family protein [Bacteroidales bacterium]
MNLFSSIFLYDENKPLLFTKPFFWYFFLIVLLFYFFIKNKKELRSLYLLLVSVFFYYKSGGYFFVLLLLSTLIDYMAGLYIYRANTKTKKNLGLVVSIFSNLFILFYFKYTYFVIDIINSLLNTNINTFNILADISNRFFNTGFDVSNIILPVGISFYTFQSMSYTIDVYRMKIAPEKSFINFAFYVSFFPQLVAGPIVRAKEFLSQIKKDYYITKEIFSYAVFLILNGLIKKIIISDYISVNFVDRVFENPSSFSGIENLFAVYGYAIQIYCDFSGYSDIAIGLGLIMGFRLPVNFNSPYKATSITDFWHRWHISLSTWLRDYLYISLGGNRKGKFRTYINLMITMLLGGLWHGANIKFILWGGYHGVLLVIEKLFDTSNEKKMFFFELIKAFITFHLVCIGWIFFRANNINDSFKIISSISEINLASMYGFIGSYTNVVFLTIVALIVHLLPNKIKETYKGIFIRLPMPLQVIISIVVIYFLYNSATSELQPFIYFQF